MKAIVFPFAAFLAAFLVSGGQSGFEETPTELSDRSVYQLSSTWYDQDGAALTLESLAGRPQLVALIFTHCGYTCPRIVDDLKSIVRELPHKDLGVVLVSIDPERDTSEALKHFSEMHKLTSWTLVRGRDEDVRELSAALGLRYKKESGGEFAHSNTITLLNAGGEIIAQSLGSRREELIRWIGEL